jgi:NDP-sugar pyrophosphorylase family protein
VRDRLIGGTFAVINGKIITDLDLGAALETHRREQGTGDTRPRNANQAREHFREVLLDDAWQVTGFGQFP